MILYYIYILDVWPPQCEAKPRQVEWPVTRLTRRILFLWPRAWIFCWLIEEPMTYWCLVGNEWEWGNGMILDSDYGSFPHSLQAQVRWSMDITILETIVKHSRLVINQLAYHESILHAIEWYMWFINQSVNPVTVSVVALPIIRGPHWRSTMGWDASGRAVSRNSGYYLLGGLEPWNFYDFPYIGNNNPNWLSYFSEGLKPPTSYRFGYKWP